MLWNKGGEAFCQRRHGGLAKTKTRTKSVSSYSCYLTLFFSPRPTTAATLATFSPVFVIKKLMSGAFVGSGLYQMATLPAPHQSDSTPSTLWAPPGHLTEFRGNSLLCSSHRQHKQFITSELLLYLRMTHIKFWPINFEMDFWNGS